MGEISTSVRTLPSITSIYICEHTQVSSRIFSSQIYSVATTRFLANIYNTNFLHFFLHHLTCKYQIRHISLSDTLFYIYLSIQQVCFQLFERLTSPSGNSFDKYRLAVGYSTDVSQTHPQGQLRKFHSDWHNRSYG